MMGKVIFCFTLTVAVRMVVVLAHQGDTEVGSSVTLPCQYGHHKNIQSDLLDIQWWIGEHLVMWFQLGRILQGSRYINRTYLSTEGLRNGDFSLSITHTEYSDSGRYRCVLTIEGQEVALGEVDLEVKVPRSQSSLFIESGQKVVLSCFGRVDWSGSEAAFIQWKRWTQVVLEWKSGSLFVDPMFEGRVSVPKERIVHGDISLIFNETLPDDDGYYVCFFKKNDDIRLSTIINLTITEQLSRVNKTSGTQLQLPLPSKSPVMLSFLPDGGNCTVSVCELDGTKKVTFDGPFSLLGVSVVGVCLFGLVVISASFGCVWYKLLKLNRVPIQKTGKHMEKELEKGSEMLPLQFTHDDSISPSKSAVI